MSHDDDDGGDGGGGGDDDDDDDDDGGGDGGGGEVQRAARGEADTNVQTRGWWRGGARQLTSVLFVFHVFCAYVCARARV